MGLFGEPKLKGKDFSDCVNYLEEHYKLTTFQEKEADKYNEALALHVNSPMVDVQSGIEMLKATGRLRSTAHELVKRGKQLSFIPDAAGKHCLTWQIMFLEYTAWTDAQFMVYQTIVEGKQAYTQRVQFLFQQQEEAHKMALEEEEKFLKRLMKSGLAAGDIQRLTDKAFEAVEADN